MFFRLVYILFYIFLTQSSVLAQSDFFNLVIPNTTAEVDLHVWKPYKSPNVPAGKGHTNEWISKDGYRLAFDADGENSHWHVYNKVGKRLQANGKLAGYNKNGKMIYKKGAPNAHFKSGNSTQIKVSKSSWIAKTNQTKAVIPKTKNGKISGTFGIVAIFLNLSSIIIDSPQSPLYTFQSIATGEQYKATIDFSTGIIYEWHCLSTDCKTRRLDYFKDYDYIDGQWRGTGWYGFDLFDKNGKKIINY